MFGIRRRGNNIDDDAKQHNITSIQTQTAASNTPAAQTLSHNSRWLGIIERMYENVNLVQDREPSNQMENIYYFHMNKFWRNDKGMEREICWWHDELNVVLHICQYIICFTKRYLFYNICTYVHIYFVPLYMGIHCITSTRYAIILYPPVLLQSSSSSRLLLILYTFHHYCYYSTVRMFSVYTVQ